MSTTYTVTFRVWGQSAVELEDAASATLVVFAIGSKDFRADYDIEVSPVSHTSLGVVAAWEGEVHARVVTS